MKASVQYNDLIGSAAADVSDFHHNNLQYFMKNTFKEYEDTRYMCEGCRIYMSDQSDKANVHFICYDNKQEHYIYLTPLKEFTLQEMVSMFKRFEIFIGQNVDSIQVDDVDWFNLK